MKIKLTSVYGDKNPGDIIDVDEAEGKRVVEICNGAVLPTAEELAALAPAKAPAKAPETK